MLVCKKEIRFDTEGEAHIIDITSQVQEMASEAGISNGMVCVFVPGSTGAVTTIEFEPGLLKDIPDALERLFPKDMTYEHHLKWHDGNGHSHVRAAFLGASLTVPISDCKLTLGTWQQIVFIDMDARARKRTVILEFIGEGHEPA